MSLRSISSVKKKNVERQTVPKFSNQSQEKRDPKILPFQNSNKLRLSVSQVKLPRTSFERKFQINRYIQRLQITYKNKHLHQDGSHLALNKKKKICLQIGANWLEAVCQVEQLMGYFIHKGKKQFVSKFAELLMLVLREQNNLNYDEMKRIHTIPIKSSEFSQTKAILFSIIFRLKYVFTGEEIFGFFRRIEYLRFCIFPQNELFRYIPIEVITEHLASCEVDSDRGLLSMCVYFLVHCTGLQAFRHYIKFNRVRISKANMQSLKYELLKMFSAYQFQDCVYFKLFQNFRYIESLLLSGSSLTDFIETRGERVEAFIAAFKSSEFFTKKIAAANSRLVDLLLIYILDSNNYALSSNDFKSAIIANFPKELLYQLTKSLLCFCKKAMVPENQISMLKKEMKRVVNNFYYKSASSTELLLKKFDELKFIFMKFNKQYKGKFCNLKILALICGKIVPFDFRQLRSLHQRCGVGQHQFSFMEQCLGSLQEDNVLKQVSQFVTKAANFNKK